MKRDYIVMVLIIGGVLLSLFLLVKKEDVRKALLAVLVSQVCTWPMGMLIVSLGAIEYPVRLFPRAIDSSFLHGYILNPSIYAIYYIHYPRHAKSIWKWLYTLLITAIPATIEVMENKYTNLVHYKNWNVYYSWILLMIFYFMIRKYLDWFFVKVSQQGVSDNEA